MRTDTGMESKIPIKRILVTGCCGFIGANFVRYRAGDRPGDRDHEPRCADLRRQSRQPGGDRHETRAIASCSGDIADRPLVMKLVAEGGFDAIVNFAAESHVDRSISDATPFLRTNVVGHAVPARRGAGSQGRPLRPGLDRRGLRHAPSPTTRRSPRPRRWRPTAPMPPARPAPTCWSAPPTTPSGWTPSSPAARTTTAPTSSPRS